MTLFIAPTNTLQLRINLGHGVGRIGPAKHLLDVLLETFLLMGVQLLNEILCPGQ